MERREPRKEAVDRLEGLIELLESRFAKKERLMRRLHEDLVERIARMNEGRNR